MSERIQIGLQAAVVGFVLVAAVFGIVSSAVAEQPRAAAPTVAPPDASLIASTLRTPTPTPAPAATPSATFATLPPTPIPTATPKPIQTVPYSLSGRAYTGVTADKGTVFIAPFDARVEVIVYQIVNGEFFTNTDYPDRPQYPYVFLYPEDGRVMKFRPGALKTDTEILVGQSEIRAGTPLFRVIGTGPSSWQARYDSTVGAQVIVSLETGAGQDLDASRLIRTQ